MEVGLEAGSHGGAGSPYLVLKKCVETKGEGDDKEKDDPGHFEEGPEDIGEHDNIDSKVGHLPDEGEKIEPGHGHCYSSLREG